MFRVEIRSLIPVLCTAVALAALVAVRSRLPHDIAGWLPAGESSDLLVEPNDGPLFDYVAQYRQGDDAWQAVIPGGQVAREDLREHAYALVERRYGEALPEDYRNHVWVTIQPNGPLPPDPNEDPVAITWRES